MIGPRRIAITILFATLGLALLGQPSALSTPKVPRGASSANGAGSSEQGTVTTVDPALVTSTTIPVPETTTTETLPPDTTAVLPDNSNGNGPPQGVAAGNAVKETPSPDPTPSSDPDPSPQVDAAPVAPAISVATTQSKMLSQVGGSVGFKVKVTNESADTMQGVTIVNVIPAEMDAGPVRIGDEVDAAFHGVSPTSEDIVWVLKDLAAGDTVTLPWRANVVTRGDLRAVNETQAKFGDAEMQEAETTTYLATAGKRAPHNPAPMVRKKIVTVESVEVPAEEQPTVLDDVAGAPSTDPLPLTGSNPRPVIAIGLVLIALGILFIGGASRIDRRKLVIASLLLLTACVSSTTDSANSPTATTVEDKVKGTRFDKRDNKKNGNEPGGNEGGPTTTSLPFSPEGSPEGGPEPTVVAVAPTEVTEAPAPTVTSIVRHVSFEVVEADLANSPLESRPGDNTITLDWSETQGLNSAASSTILTADAPVDIQTALSEANGSIQADVVMRNIKKDETLTVDGRLVHTVVDDATGAVVATLRSDPFDMTLNPDGTVQAHFTYLLPTGNYTLTSAFEAAP